jgi:hypothetical protein
MKLRVINSLKGNSYARFDEIPEFLVKCCVHYIKNPLTYACNISVKSGVFPGMMKIPKISPLFKKGDKLDIWNYRPNTLLSVFSKILEKIMYHRLLF